jgi:hypothetical protein
MPGTFAEVTFCAILITRVVAVAASQPPPTVHGGDTHPGQTSMKGAKVSTDDSDVFTQLDDPALFSRRAEIRAELERLPPESPVHAALAALYDLSTEEIDARARAAWSRPN